MKLISAVMRIRLRLAAVGALAVLTLGAGVLCAIGLAAPETALGRAMPLAMGSEARGDASMIAVEPVDIAKVERETKRTFALAPATASAWLRWAWLADRAGDQARMNDALERSYAVAPFGPDVTVWRLGFLFNRWGRLTPSLRSQAVAELGAAWRDRPAQIRTARTQIEDRTGALAFDFSVSGLEIEKKLTERLRPTPAR